MAHVLGLPPAVPVHADAVEKLDGDLRNAPAGWDRRSRSGRCRSARARASPRRSVGRSTHTSAQIHQLVLDVAHVVGRRGGVRQSGHPAVVQDLGHPQACIHVLRNDRRAPAWACRAARRPGSIRGRRGRGSRRCAHGSESPGRCPGSHASSPPSGARSRRCGACRPTPAAGTPSPAAPPESRRVPHRRGRSGRPG